MGYKSPNTSLVHVGCSVTTLTDALTTFFSNINAAANTTEALCKMFFGRKGTITGVSILVTNGNTPTTETVALYIRKNAGSDILIADIAFTGTSSTYYQNFNLNIQMEVTDYITFKVVCPTWATDPTSTRFTGHIVYVHE